MATAGQNISNPLPAALEIPDPVQGFGRDGGQFYRCYDAMAKEIDEDMTTGLKEQLDGLLVFAGLFAGVNTAFLAFTLPLMTASPTDDTNALLTANNAILLDILQGRNESSRGPPTLPSSSFSLSGDIFIVNVLFSMSLALALVSSFIAVLGRQWLIYYRKRGGGGPERQRLDQIQRFLGAKKWRLELILDDVLPSLLQVGLVIFWISLVIYLHVINPRLSYIICSVLGVAVAVVIFTAICAGWDNFCPFQSPLSHLASWGMFTLPSHLLYRLFFNFLYIGFFCFSRVQQWLESIEGDSTRVEAMRAADRRLLQHMDRIGPGFLGAALGPRKDNPDELHVVAIERIISVSDDAPALLHAVANVFAIQDRQLLTQLAQEGLRERLFGLRRDIYNGILHLRGFGHTEVAEAGARLVSGAIAHIILSMPDDIDSEVGFNWLQYSVRQLASDVPTTFTIPVYHISSTSRILLESYLAYVVSLRELDFPVNDCLSTTIQHYSEYLTSPSWRLISLVAIAIASLKCDGNETLASVSSYLFRRGRWRRKLRAAYVGDIDSALVSLEHAVTETAKFQETHPTNDHGLELVLVRILKSAHQAIFDEKGDPSVGIMHVSTLLRLTVHYIRTLGNISHDRKRLQIDVVKIFQDTCARLTARRRIPVALLEHFASLLNSLGTARLEMFSDEDEVEEVLQSFGPLVQELFTLEPSAWHGQLDSAGLQSLDALRDIMRQAYISFKLNVDRFSYLMKRGRRADWDPEVRWCHWLDQKNDNDLSQVSGHATIVEAGGDRSGST